MVGRLFSWWVQLWDVLSFWQVRIQPKRSNPNIARPRNEVIDGALEDEKPYDDGSANAERPDNDFKNLNSCLQVHVPHVDRGLTMQCCVAYGVLSATHGVPCRSVNPQVPGSSPGRGAIDYKNHLPRWFFYALTTRKTSIKSKTYRKSWFFYSKINEL